VEHSFYFILLVTFSLYSVNRWPDNEPFPLFAEITVYSPRQAGTIGAYRREAGRLRVTFYSSIMLTFNAEQPTLKPMETMKPVCLENEHSRYWLERREWATSVLKTEDVIFANGKSAHEIADRVLEEAETELIEDYALQVFVK